MGIWYVDERMDIFEISDERVRKNALSVPAICMEDDFLDTGDGYVKLKVKHYGKTYNLCTSERFYNQPVAGGFLNTGVLVAGDVVATAAHCVDKKNVMQLRFLFGYVMSDPISPVIRFPHEKVYRGTEILHWEYDIDEPNAAGSDWTLVKLDRKVEGQEKAKLSNKPVFYEQPIYVLGYPCGLPLKYAPGASIQKVEKSYFTAPLDVFSGNSASPVFSAETHELVGIVTQGDPEDFQWTKNGVVSMIYPNSELKSSGSQCIKASEFNKYIISINDKDDVDGIRIESHGISTPSQEEKFLKKFRSEIEKNLSDQDLSIDALCKKLHMGRSELFRKVKAITGQTPNEYINYCRLERAVQLFKKKYGTVSEVAVAVGYSDPNYFSKLFKKKFNQSPKAFQLSHLKSRTPQKDKIFNGVKEFSELSSTLNEVLKHLTISELTQILQKAIRDKKEEMYR